MFGELKYLELLYKVCSLLLQVQNDTECFNQAACTLCRDLKAVSCSIWLASPNGGVGQQRVAYCESAEPSVKYLSDFDFKIASSVIEQKRPLIFHKVAPDRNLPQGITDNLRVTARLLSIHNEVIGAFCIWTARDLAGQSREDFQSFVQKLSSELANGLYNFKYYSNDSRKRLKKELEIARKIQLGFIPEKIPHINGISLGFQTVAANEVGGDYLDLFLTRNRNLGIAIGDVMGKGVPAALWTAMTRVAMRAAALDDTQPQLAIEQVNSVLYPDLAREGMFVTLLYAIYNPGSKTLLFSNAGHLPPLLYRLKTRTVEQLIVKGPYVGGLENKRYRVGGVQLQPGDVVLFYTDGLTEAINAEQQQFGIEMVKRIMCENALYKATEISDLLSFKVGRHIGDCRQNDDITFAVLKVEK